MFYLAGIVLSFLGAVLMAIWAFSFRVENGRLIFSPELGGLFMLLGRIGFVVFGVGFMVQLIHECCLLS